MDEHEHELIEEEYPLHCVRCGDSWSALKWIATLTTERDQALKNVLSLSQSLATAIIERDRLLRAADDFWAMWKDPESVMVELDEDGRWAMEQAKARALAGTGETP